MKFLLNAIQNVVFNIEKGLYSQNYSSPDYHLLIKNSTKQSFPFPPLGGGFPLLLINAIWKALNSPGVSDTCLINLKADMTRSCMYSKIGLQYYCQYYCNIVNYCQWFTLTQSETKMFFFLNIRWLYGEFPLGITQKL